MSAEEPVYTVTTVHGDFKSSSTSEVAVFVRALQPTGTALITHTPTGARLYVELQDIDALDTRLTLLCQKRASEASEVVDAFARVRNAAHIKLAHPDDPSVAQTLPADAKYAMDRLLIYARKYFRGLTDKVMLLDDHLLVLAEAYAQCQTAQTQTQDQIR